jgi:hypothetical protein
MSIILKVAKKAFSKTHEVETVVEHLGVGCTQVRVVEVKTDYEAKYDNLDLEDYYRSSVKWNLVLSLDHLGATSAFHFPIAHSEGCLAMAKTLFRVAERIRKTEQSEVYDSTGARVDARPMDKPQSLVVDGVKVDPSLEGRTVLVESDRLTDG